MNIAIRTFYFAVAAVLVAVTLIYCWPRIEARAFDIRMVATEWARRVGRELHARRLFGRTYARRIP